MMTRGFANAKPPKPQLQNQELKTMHRQCLNNKAWLPMGSSIGKFGQKVHGFPARKKTIKFDRKNCTANRHQIPHLCSAFHSLTCCWLVAFKFGPKKWRKTSTNRAFQRILPQFCHVIFRVFFCTPKRSLSWSIWNMEPRDVCKRALRSAESW